MNTNPAPLIYKIMTCSQWEDTKQAGKFMGAPVDLQDGYIHFSTAQQTRETAAKHFANQDDLVLLAVSTSNMGDALKWEVSRGGAFFPHLYSPLSLDDVVQMDPIPLDEHGNHLFPDSIS